MVDKKMNVIDGHRRLACAKILKFKTVPVIISDSKLSKDKCYETINTCVRKMSNNESIYVYVNGGKVSVKAEKKIKLLQEILGPSELKKLGNKYISTSILEIGLKISNHCKDKNNHFIKKAILWAVKHKQSYQARKAIEDGVSIISLKRAISSDRPLKRDWK